MPDSQPASLSPERAALERANALPRGSVAIIAGGPTIEAYRIESEAIRLENLKIAEHNASCAPEARKEPMRVADQIWGIGRTAAKYPVDLAFHFARSMIEAPRNAAGDRVPVFRAKLDMRPIRAEADPLWCEYPIQQMGSLYGLIYAECCGAYALMMARHYRFEHIKLFGLEYIDNVDARACMEFWIGALSMLGIPTTIYNGSVLTGVAKQRIPYGYEATPALAQPLPRFVP